MKIVIANKLEFILEELLESSATRVAHVMVHTQTLATKELEGRERERRGRGERWNFGPKPLKECHG